VLLCVSVADRPLARDMWEELLDALDAVSPLVDDVRPGLAFVDMRGIAGDARAWMARARETLLPFGLPLRLGVGANAICARAAAYTGDGTVCEAGRERAMLEPLPLALLDIDAGTLQRLQLLSIERLGDLARLPHGPFVRRFGPAAARWHEWARGIDRTPFVPRGHAVAIEAASFGEGSAQDEAQVIFALRMLLARVGADLERCGKRAGMLCLDIELEDGETHGFEIALAAPTAQERAMLDVMRAKLEGMTFAAPIVGLRVRAMRLEEGGEVQPLFTGDDLDAQTIAVTLARLEAALGEPVRRARTLAAHVLEDRFSYDRFELPKRDMFAGPPAELAGQVVPQLRLLTVREIAVRVRAGAPAFVGEPPQAVVECAGPWRIEGGWFDSPVDRDEYDVLLEDGELYRIYRQKTRWYLRGAYD
jgi:protein ImuB